MNSRHRNFLAILGILVVIYSVSVLAFVITSPDLRLRWLVSAPDQVSLPSQGVPIWTVEGIQVMGEQPRDEDVLLEVADKPIHTYLDLAEVMFDLYLPKEDPSGSNLLSENSDPSELPEDWIAPVVQIHNGPRMAEIRFQSMSEPGQPVHRAFVVIQSLPWNEMIPTIVWFLIQLSIFAVAGIAFWNRPFDASTQMFYIVCMFGLGAFVGGFHWWMIGGSPFMNAPFIIMGLFLPAVLLHFFLVYPRSFPFLAQRKKLTLSLIYAPPALGLIAIGALLQYLRGINSQLLPETLEAGSVTHLRQCLHYLSDAVWYSLLISGFYFLATVVAIGISRGRATTRIERMQLTVMLLAGCVAILPIGYSIWLAHFARVKFVMGEARIPMLVASLVFQLAFVIGIIRYKLMLADQLLTRDFVYYLSSMGLTIGFACLIATVTLIALRMKISLNAFQYLAVVGLFVIATLLLLGVRDRMQQSIDRRFYREKYQLDNALRRMQNASVGKCCKSMKRHSTFAKKNRSALFCRRSTEKFPRPMLLSLRSTILNSYRRRGISKGKHRKVSRENWDILWISKPWGCKLLKQSKWRARFVDYSCWEINGITHLTLPKITHFCRLSARLPTLACTT